MTKALTQKNTKKAKVRVTHFCLFVFATLVVNNSSLAAQGIQLKEARWLSEQANKTQALSQRPSECINPKAPAIANIGRIALQSPALLGGQAARMNLSCASCHPSGRTNVNFFLDTVSSIPGSADVTHHFFSSNGGDNTLTAVMIPDLAKPEQNKIKDRKSEQFRQKLVQLIEVEFDGQTAPSIILDGLQSYLANTNIEFCSKDTQKLIRFTDDWSDLIDIIDALPIYSDQATNTFLIRAARKQIEQIYWRFKNINNTEIDNTLIALSRMLDKTSLSVTSHKKQSENLLIWQKSADQTYHFLVLNQARSAYNPMIIKDLLED